MSAWQDSLTSFLTQIANAVPGIIAALLLLVVAWVVAKIISAGVRKLIQKSGLERKLSAQSEERSSKKEGPAASIAERITELYLASEGNENDVWKRSPEFLKSAGEYEIATRLLERWKQGNNPTQE